MQLIKQWSWSHVLAVRFQKTHAHALSLQPRVAHQCLLYLGKDSVEEGERNVEMPQTSGKLGWVCWRVRWGGSQQGELGLMVQIFLEPSINRLSRDQCSTACMWTARYLRGNQCWASLRGSLSCGERTVRCKSRTRPGWKCPLLISCNRGPPLPQLLTL